MNNKKVALFISHLFGEYQKNLCSGIMAKATEYGYHVDIFASFDGETIKEFGQGESSILHIPNYSTYHGIIFASDTYLESSLKQHIYQTIQTQCSCPIVDITQSSVNSDFYTISIDNITPMAELVTHLITTHKYQRISFLASKQETQYSLQRLDSYKKTLEQFHLSFGESSIAWCYPNEESIAESIEFLLTSQPQIPEVIICYNDTIALIASKILSQKGYVIPEDIAITGYDNLEPANYHIPPITSIEFPVKEQGEQAMELIIKHNLGELLEKTIIVPAHPVILSSCGCHHTYTKNNSHYNLDLLNTIYQREQEMIADINLSSSLLNVTDIDEGIEILAEFIQTIDSLQEFYLCLNWDWDCLSNSILDITNTEELDTCSGNLKLLKLGMKNGKPIPQCSFSNDMLLPEHIYHNNPFPFIYLPLFFKEKNFGYVALSYKNNHIQYSLSFMLWLRNINTMLQTIINNYEKITLINQLQTLYLKDERTQLWNLKGLRKQCESLMVSNHTPMTLLTLHMDSLDYINSVYGDNESELCILVLANAIKSNQSEFLFASRTEKNTFLLLLENSTTQDSIRLAKKIEQYVKNYFKLYKKPYEITLLHHCDTYRMKELLSLLSGEY